MKDHPERVLMPMIDSLNPEDFSFRNGGIGCTLGFLWTLTEHSIPIQPADQARRSNVQWHPFSTPPKKTPKKLPARCTPSLVTRRRMYTGLLDGSC